MSAGTCGAECAADTTCYSLQFYHTKRTADVCEIRAYNLAKAELCRQQRDCRMCVEKDCIWNVAEGFLTCQSECNPLMPCDAITDNSKCNSYTSAPTPPTPLPSPTVVPTCLAKDCEICLESGCVMTVGGCSEQCAMDVACYDLQGNFKDKSAADVCKIRTDNLAKAEFCRQQRDCEKCIAGSCQWNIYLGCQSECNPLMSCDVITDSSKCNSYTSPPTPPPSPTVVPTCLAEDCEICLESGCVMTVGGCSEQCAMDVACYDLQGNFKDKSA